MDFEEKLRNYLKSNRGKEKDFDDLVYNIKHWRKEKWKKPKSKWKEYYQKERL